MITNGISISPKFTLMNKSIPLLLCYNSKIHLFPTAFAKEFQFPWKSAPQKTVQLFLAWSLPLARLNNTKVLPLRRFSCGDKSSISSSTAGRSTRLSKERKQSYSKRLGVGRCERGKTTARYLMLIGFKSIRSNIFPIWLRRSNQTIKN